ncbi:MAG: guanylate kinase [Cyclobacteriaceae bacterium]
MAGKLIIFSAPSGSGKTTIVNELIKRVPNLGFSVSATTREPRSGKEKHGEHYYFLSQQDFEKRLKEEGFAEWEEVYAGTYYGTLKSEIESIWAQGKDVIFDVDVKGGLSLKKCYGDIALSIFIKAPSVEAIVERLVNRQTETKRSIEKRVSKIKYELSFEDFFDVSVSNKELETAISDCEVLVNDFLSN